MTRVYLWGMSALESLRLTHLPAYYWLAGKVVRANAWRWKGETP